MVQVTHRIDTIVPEMQRVLFLSSGRIVGDGTTDAHSQDAPLSRLFETPLRVVQANGFHRVLPA